MSAPEFDQGYFERIAAMDAGRPSLPLLAKPCVDADGQSDCAVIGGLYTQISDDLRLCPMATRIAVSGGWFCHNHVGHACRGNAANQGRDVLRALSPKPPVSEHVPAQAAE